VAVCYSIVFWLYVILFVLVVWLFVILFFFGCMFVVFVWQYVILFFFVVVCMFVCLLLLCGCNFFNFFAVCLLLLLA